MTNKMLKPPKAAGGWKAIGYSFRKAREAGGYLRFFKALRSKNTCKTCALGMGGQKGGMVNEAGAFPEVCKKSMQAMAADMQGALPSDFFERHSIEELKTWTPRALEASGRITQPLLAGPHDTHYHPVDWDEALGTVAEQLRATPPEESFFYFSGRSSNEAGFLLQLMARLYGTNNVNSCSYYCHQASGVGLSSVTGSGTATVVLEDLEDCDLFFVIGANPASNHPRLMRTILMMKRRGGSVIVVNPLRELGLVKFKVPSDPRSLLFGTKIADDYIQPHIGGDIAFFAGVAKAVHEQDATEAAFLENHTDGWPEFRTFLESLAWDEVVAASGVARTRMEDAAQRYGRARNAVFCWAMGVTHHAHGVRGVQMIANLAMMRGMLGKPSAGLLPLRGHSNVQGIGSMGVTPQLKDAVFKGLEECFQVKLPTAKGLDTMGCIEQAHEGGMRFAWCLGGNLYGSNPDSAFAEAALSKIGFTVFLSTTLNTGHFRGRGQTALILPVLARDEERQSTTQESMFNYVRLSDGGPARHENLRSEVEVIAAVGRKLFEDGGPVDWEHLERHGNIRAAIAKVIPGYQAIEKIGETKEEFQISGRTFHTPRFATDSGRAKFHTFDLPPLVGGAAKDALRLTTIRSEGQFNTVVYEEEDLYRGQERRDIIMMSPADRERMGFAIDQSVTVTSATGVLRDIRVREIDIRSGNAAMYYPEANILVPRMLDSASRTPAFKSVAITVEA